jgi:hypothetical protein
MKNTNKQLELERNEKEEAEKEAKRQYEKDEVDYLYKRGAKQDFYMNVS